MSWFRLPSQNPFDNQSNIIIKNNSNINRDEDDEFVSDSLYGSSRKVVEKLNLLEHQIYHTNIEILEMVKQNSDYITQLRNLTKKLAEINAFALD